MNDKNDNILHSRKKEKRKKQQIILSLIDEYFHNMKETSLLVDPIIISSFNESKGRIVKDDGLYQRLYESAMDRIGKPKMRSYTARMGYEICGGKDLKGFLPIAAAMDLLEFSYYCSDKIFDTDIYTHREIVEDKIIVSHILTNSAYDLVSKANNVLSLETKNICEITSSMSRFVRDIYEGFFVENHNTEPFRELYERRTYAYNYWEHILKISAMAAEADKEKTEALANFGKYLGMAYMVTNDASDIVKDFEDIKNQRYTLPNILFLEKADEKEKVLFDSLFGNKSAGLDELKEIGQIMVDRNIIKECQAYASDLAEKSLPYLKVFEDSHWKRMLAISTRAVYNNQWYREMNRVYGFQRTVKHSDLELAGINLFNI